LFLFFKKESAFLAFLDFRTPSLDPKKYGGADDVW
jgi:hypothetical protein